MSEDSYNRNDAETDSDSTWERVTGDDVDRRRFLTGATLLGTAAFAGCSSITNQRFEAAPVVLPAADQEGLVLGETLNDDYEVTRKGPSGSLKVTVSSHAAAYSRASGVREHGTVRTAVGHYIGRVNGVEGAVTSASLVLATNVAAGGQRLAAFEEDAAIDAESVMILGPEGLRRGAAGEPISVFNAGAIGPESLTLANREGVTAFEMPGKRLFPGSMWTPSDRFFPGSMWWPGSMWIADTGWHPGKTWIPPNPDYGTDAKPAESESDTRCLVFVPAERSFEGVFGVGPGAVEARQLEAGATVDASNQIVASLGGALFDWPFAEGFPSLFTSGRPAALGGAVFDFGVLSTPNPSVASFDANPLVGMESKALLESDRARTLLRNAGVSDAEDVQWLDGPDRLSATSLALGEKLQQNVPKGMADLQPTILDSATEIESFAGVLSGRHGPWAVGVHLARATPDDHVVAIGVQRTPLESVGSIEGDARAPTPFPIISWVNWYRDARAMMRVTVSQLTVAE